MTFYHVFYLKKKQCCQTLVNTREKDSKHKNRFTFFSMTKVCFSQPMLFVCSLKSSFKPTFCVFCDILDPDFGVAFLYIRKCFAVLQENLCLASNPIAMEQATMETKTLALTVSFQQFYKKETRVKPYLSTCRTDI